jgi:hypothetical protein
MNASVVAGAVPANRDQTPMNTLLAYSIAQACEVANLTICADGSKAYELQIPDYF